MAVGYTLEGKGMSFGAVHRDELVKENARNFGKRLEKSEVNVEVLWNNGEAMEQDQLDGVIFF